MRPIVIFFTILFLILMGGMLINGNSSYQDYRLKPKAIATIDQFIREIQINNFTEKKYNTIFTDEKYFNNFKEIASNSYELDFKEWDIFGWASVLLLFETGEKFAVSVYPKKSVLIRAWFPEYKILTIRD